MLGGFQPNVFQHDYQVVLTPVVAARPTPSGIMGRQPMFSARNIIIRMKPDEVTEIPPYDLPEEIKESLPIFIRAEIVAKTEQPQQIPQTSITVWGKNKRAILGLKRQLERITTEQELLEITQVAEIAAELFAADDAITLKRRKKE